MNNQRPLYQCKIQKCPMTTKANNFELFIYENQLIIKKVRSPSILSNKPSEVQKTYQLSSPRIRISWEYKEDKLSGFKIFKNLKSLKNTEYKADEKCLKRMKDILDGKTFYCNFSQQYEVIRTMAKRKTSKILQCRNIHSGDIKVAKISKFENPLKETNSEADISIKLKRYPHKYILNNDEIYLEEDQIIYIMDYCEGGTLFNHFILNNFQIPQCNVIKIMKKILKAVIHLHELSITHRDLKYDNIMLKYPNDLTSIKIIDFGFAREGTWNQIQCGTPGYIAPEILNGQKYTQLCDIYSLGSLFHSLLSGQRLFPLNISQQQLLLLNKANFFRISDRIQDNQAIDLLKRMLSPPSDRPSANDCLNHAMFRINQTSQIISDTLKSMQNLVLKNPFQQSIGA